MKTAIMLTGLLLVAQAPKPLRYEYKVGSQFKYQLTDETTSLDYTGNDKGVVVDVSRTKVTITKKVVAFENSIGVVEESAAEGTTETTGASGKSVKVTDPTLKVYSFSPRGKVLKLERKAIPGIPVKGPGFLDGLSILLPELPVKQGMSWTATTEARGLSDKPIQVKYTTRYLSDEKRGAHPCIHFSTSFKSGFVVSEVERGKVTASLSGTIDTYFSTKIGQEESQDLQMELKVTSTPKDGTPIVRGTRISSKQKLVN